MPKPPPQPDRQVLYFSSFCITLHSERAPQLFKRRTVSIQTVNETSDRKIDMVDLHAVYTRYEDELSKALNTVAASGRYIRGENVRQLETELASYVGTTHAITCANGTEAITLALMALGLKQGDEVIVPSHSFIATAEAASLIGINVIFADIDPKSFNILPKDVERKITPKTRAIIPVHLYGRMADMEPIMDIAARHNLFVVEDAAQSFGATQTIRGQKKMACSVGHIGCTSFFPTKNLACMGDGGALFTNSDELAARIRMFASHGSVVKYNSEAVGLNSRLDEIQAAVLRVKLRHIDEILSRRRSAAMAYRNALKGNDFFVLPDYADGHTFNQFTIRVNYGCRDDVRQYLSNHSIGSMVYYPTPIHLQPVFAQGSLSLPETERACREVLSIPIHSEITPDDIRVVADTLNAWHIGAHLEK